MDLKDELLKGSLVLFIMISIFNVFNWVFHFSMARMLSAEDYGVLAVLMSIFYIFAIPSEAIQTIITKYTSKFNANKEYGKIKYLMEVSLKNAFLFASILFILLIPIMFLVSQFLSMDIRLLLLANFFIFIVFLTPVIRGILQGRKKFVQLGLNMIIESVIKVVLAIVFVFIGWKVFGALAAILITGVIVFLIIFFVIKEILRSEREVVKFDNPYKNNIYIIVAIISIVLIYSLDIILAKRFFSPELAGKYAVLSMLGKMILFGTSAIGKAMFPLSSEGYEKGKNTREMLIKSLKITVALSLIVLLVYLFFPKLVIGILFGSKYVDMAGYLFIIGVSFTLIAISNIIILYKLSINRMKKSAFFLIAFVILQIVLLSIFSSTIFSFSIAFFASNLALFIYVLLMLKD